jgi:hypothetical protein
MDLTGSGWTLKQEVLVYRVTSDSIELVTSCPLIEAKGDAYFADSLSRVVLDGYSAILVDDRFDVLETSSGAYVDNCMGHGMNLVSKLNYRFHRERENIENVHVWATEIAGTPEESRLKAEQQFWVENLQKLLMADAIYLCTKVPLS